VVGFVLLLTVIPVSVAARLTGGGGVTRASAVSGPTRRERRAALDVPESAEFEPAGL